MTKRTPSPIEMSREEFRQSGHQLIEDIAEFIGSISQKPVTTQATAGELQSLLDTHASLPEIGTPAPELLSHATDLLFNHSLLNGHPKFLGYITSSAAPLGALADLLAATVNPNVGAQILSPMATEIEKQTVRWLAEFIGLSPDYGGLLVSGGNMANFTAFLAARTAKAPTNFKEEGMAGAAGRLRIYCAKTTHTWIEKAVVLFGHGTKSLRWIPIDTANRMDYEILVQTIQADLEAGDQPFMVVGTAGDVSTGVVDDLKELATICRKYDLWFHIDGAYGIPAAVLPELKQLFDGAAEADSIALDPHKWLYNPLEAGCVLVKKSQHLIDTYSAHPEYYNFSQNREHLTHNYYEYGLQNSRGFRALKVWLTLQQVGRSGYMRLIREDIELSKRLFALAERHPELEAISQNLSITTFRYIPLNQPSDSKEDALDINTLNLAILNQLQAGGEAFLSNAIVGDKYCLRGCVVNFRTTEKDIEEIIDIIVRTGRKIHAQRQEPLAFTE